MTINSRQKGARGERQWRDELRAHGYEARRGQQFSGSPESPDVVCPDLSWIHFEVKAVERLNLEDAMEQARRDASRNGAALVPIVAHRRNFRPWLVTMTAETFFQFLHGELPKDDVSQASMDGTRNPVFKQVGEAAEQNNQSKNQSNET
jgi:Holliday junction resolvase